ncbi:baseplate hub protein [Ursidibacter arcticus]
MASFTKKKLRISFVFGQQDPIFDDEGNNTIITDGLRVTASIQSGNGAVMPSAKLMIYGLSQRVMDKLTKIRWNTEDAKLNYVRLEASQDGGESYVLVYEGVIQYAYPNFGSSPEVILTIDSTAGLQHKIRPVPPLSFKGEVDVAAVVEKICKKMGMLFENNGVTGRVSNPYLPETALDQVLKLCQAVNAQAVIEFNTIAITPIGQPREIAVPMISPKTGLIGYPVPTITGVRFQCLFDPAIRFKGIVQIKESLIEACNGQWLIMGVTHYLESEMAGGRWLSEIEAIYPSGGIKIVK